MCFTGDRPILCAKAATQTPEASMQRPNNGYPCCKRKSYLEGCHGNGPGEDHPECQGHVLSALGQQSLPPAVLPHYLMRRNTVLAERQYESCYRLGNTYVCKLKSGLWIRSLRRCLESADPAVHQPSRIYSVHNTIILRWQLSFYV